MERTRNQLGQSFLFDLFKLFPCSFQVVTDGSRGVDEVQIDMFESKLVVKDVRATLRN